MLLKLSILTTIKRKLRFEKPLKQHPVQWNKSYICFGALLSLPVGAAQAQAAVTTRHCAAEPAHPTSTALLCEFYNTSGRE